MLGLLVCKFPLLCKEGQGEVETSVANLMENFSAIVQIMGKCLPYWLVPSSDPSPLVEDVNI